jgi:hypothetical protein
MDDPIAFEKWTGRAEATVGMYVGFDVAFDHIDDRPTWSARGHVAAARGEGTTLAVVEYQASAGAVAAGAEERRYPCTKDGARLAGEQIAEFLRTGRLAKE